MLSSSYTNQYKKLGDRYVTYDRRPMQSHRKLRNHRKQMETNHNKRPHERRKKIQPNQRINRSLLKNTIKSTKRTEKEEIVEKRVEKDPIASYYKLTEKGLSLENVFTEINTWAEEWLETESTNN